MRETTYRKKLCLNLRRMGAIIVPYVGSAAQMSGTPDVYVSHRKFRGFLEFKGPTTVIKPIQIAAMKRLIVTGTPCFVVRAPKIKKDKAGLLQSHIGETYRPFVDYVDLLDALQYFAEELIIHVRTK